MNRRTFLQGTGALGAFTLAGCIADDESGTPSPGSGDDPTPDGADDATPTVTDTAIERTDNGCASGEGAYASTSLDDEEMAVTFTGRITTGNPCYRPTIEGTEYDSEADRLTITVGAEAKDKVCVDCVGYIDFSGTVSVEGALPGDAVVAHDGETLSPAGDEATDTGSADDTGNGGDTPTLRAGSFSVTDVSSRSPERSADISFNEDEGTVVVTGTIVGANGCTTADLGSASYERDADRLDVNVVTELRDGAEDQYCTQQQVGIDYEATFPFDGGIPSSASVSHDGEGVGSAAYGSSSASGPDADN